MKIRFEAYSSKPPVNRSRNAEPVEPQDDAERLRGAALSWDEFAERHGSFADEFTTL